MYPMLREDAELYTFFDEDKCEMHYAMKNVAGDVFIISHDLYYKLLGADGTRELKLNPRCVSMLVEYGILINTRIIRDSDDDMIVIIKRFKPQAKHLRRKKPILQYMLPIAAVLSLSMGMLLTKETTHHCINVNILSHAAIIVFSIVLHEFGHVIVARENGCKVYYAGLILKGIHPFSPFIKYGIPDDEHYNDVFVALAGIELNFILVGIFAVLSICFPHAACTFLYGCTFNFIAAIINMCPGKGYDGERALSAVVGVQSIHKKASHCLKNKLHRKCILRHGVKGYARILSYVSIIFFSWLPIIATVVAIAMAFILR